MPLHTFRLHDSRDITKGIEVTDPKGKEVALKDVPKEDLVEVLEMIHGLVINGRWTTSV